MEYIHGTEDFKLERSSAVTLGKFDGVRGAVGCLGRCWR